MTYRKLDLLYKEHIEENKYKDAVYISLYYQFGLDKCENMETDDIIPGEDVI